MAKKIYNFVATYDEEETTLPLIIPDETSVKEFHFPENEYKNVITDVVRLSDSYTLTCTQTLREKE